MVTLGKHSYGNIQMVGSTWGKVTVGKYTSIGENVVAFMSSDHNMDNISTYPFGHRKMPITKIMKPPLPTKKNFNTNARLNLNVGNDVWIGYSAILFGDVTIGDGAVVGAYSIITEDVPPYSIVVGHSRIIRKRFSDEDIEFLLKLKWWDWEDQKVADIANTLSSSDLETLKTFAKQNE